MKKKEYLYVCITPKGEIFATYGNFSTGYNHPAAKYEIVSEEYAKSYYTKISKYGFVKNVSDSRLPKHFKVIYQEVH